MITSNWCQWKSVEIADLLMKYLTDLEILIIRLSEVIKISQSALHLKQMTSHKRVVSPSWWLHLTCSFGVAYFEIIWLLFDTSNALMSSQCMTQIYHHLNYILVASTCIMWVQLWICTSVMNWELVIWFTHRARGVK